MVTEGSDVQTKKPIQENGCVKANERETRAGICRLNNVNTL
jgi:hypothetical protein